jgi:hypothetical protein
VDVAQLDVVGHGPGAVERFWFTGYGAPLAPVRADPTLT